MKLVILPTVILLCFTMYCFSMYTNIPFNFLNVERKIRKNIIMHVLIDSKVQGISPKNYYAMICINKKMYRHIKKIPLTTNLLTQKFFYACKANKLSLVKKLCLEHPWIAIAKLPSGWTGLHFASEGGSLSVVKYLVSAHKVNINALTYSGWTPVLCASESGDVQVMTFLLRARANVNSALDNIAAWGLNWTSLMIATWKDNYPLVKLLLRHKKTMVNKTDSQGYTALMYAAERGYFKIVCALLSDPRTIIDVKNNDGNTALQLAKKNGHSKVTSLMLSSCWEKLL